MRPFYPNNPSAGNSVSATLIKQLIAEVRASRLIAGIGLKARRTPHGTIVDAKKYNQPASRIEFRDEHPWMLKQVENEATGEKELRWMNKFLQVGLSVYNFDDAVFGLGVTGDDMTDDGSYFLKVKLKDQYGNLAGKPEVEVETSDSTPANDFDEGIVYFYIGRIENEKQVMKITQVPVVYTYL